MAKILVVDDSKIIRVTLSNMLESLGHEVVGVAEDGLKAYEKYKELNPDIVTMDISMPNLDGIGAVKKICNEFKDAKILMVSSIEDRTLTYEAIAVGALDFIGKPPKAEELDEKINKLV